MKTFNKVVEVILGSLVVLIGLAATGIIGTFAFVFGKSVFG